MTDIDITKNLLAIRQSLPEGVKLTAVSKFHPADYVLKAYEQGQRIYGESREQELQEKAKRLPADIQWHFIGHLQTNKVKYIAPYIAMIEAVDSLKLLREINKEAAKNNRVIKVLLELHIAQEESKYGLTPEACRQLLEEGEWRTMQNVSICGLMMMASNTDNKAQIAAEFDRAFAFYKELKSTYFADNSDFTERSWGMSHDYKIAIEHGSTIVRIGSAIFGPRGYSCSR